MADEQPNPQFDFAGELLRAPILEITPDGEEIFDPVDMKATRSEFMLDREPHMVITNPEEIVMISDKDGTWWTPVWREGVLYRTLAYA
jgi:hypothetical protein